MLWQAKSRQGKSVGGGGGGGGGGAAAGRGQSTSLRCGSSMSMTFCMSVMPTFDITSCIQEKQRERYSQRERDNERERCRVWGKIEKSNERKMIPQHSSQDLSVRLSVSGLHIPRGQGGKRA